MHVDHCLSTAACFDPQQGLYEQRALKLSGLAEQELGVLVGFPQPGGARARRRQYDGSFMALSLASPAKREHVAKVARGRQSLDLVAPPRRR